MNYNGGVYQYEEREMKKRARKQWLPLLRHGGIDILLTHAPARRINDGDDLPHRDLRPSVICWTGNTRSSVYPRTRAQDLRL